MHECQCGLCNYSVGTPGGIFDPMLVIGSHLGLLVGLVTQAVAPSYAPEPAALALIGMAAFFTATVRARSLSEPSPATECCQPSGVARWSRRCLLKRSLPGPQGCPGAAGRQGR